MPIVYIDNLAEGMTLAADLKSPTGRFILAKGATLKAEHLQRFRTWGIVEADIDEKFLGDEYAQQQDEIAQFYAQAEKYLQQRFTLNNLNQEPLTTIYRQALSSCAQQMQKGWTPDIAFDVQDTTPDIKQIPIHIAALLAGEVELFSLPKVYTQIVQTLEHPETSAQKIADVVSKDASLSGRLLQLANSPIFSFSGKVDSISRAISILGTKDLSTLVLGISVVRKFDNVPSHLFNMEDFWRHSIRCGLYARILASHLRLPGEEKYFTGGLLHDIGRLILIEKVPEQFTSVISRAVSKRKPAYQAEQDFWQTDHSSIGKELAKLWRLPSSLVQMIGGHHSPGAAHYQLEPCLIHVADILAHACGQELSIFNEIPALQAKAWEVTGLSESMLAQTVRQVDAEFEKVVQIFF